MRNFMSMLVIFFTFLFSDFVRVARCEGGFIRFGNRLMEEAGEGEGGGGEGEGSGEGEGQGSGSEEEDFDSLPDWAKKKFGSANKEISALRKENAQRRTSGKDIGDKFDKMQAGLKKAFGMEEEGEEVDFNEQISELTESLGEAQFNNAITEMAYENDIPKDKIGFFKYRLNESLANVADGEELPAEVMSALIQEVKGAGKGSGDTGVSGEGDGGKVPNGEGDGQKKDFSKMTAEDFVRTSDGDKNVLFKNDRATYDRLHAEAKSKRLYKY